MYHDYWKMTNLVHDTKPNIQFVKKSIYLYYTNDLSTIFYKTTISVLFRMFLVNNVNKNK